MGAYLIGVDIGTQGAKTCLYGADGRAVSSAFEPSNLIMPGDGVVEQRPDEICASVVRTVRAVMDQSGVPPSAVVALGMDGQMAGILGVDDDFNAVTPYDSWLDTRCESGIRLMKHRAEARVIELTGAPVSYAHGPKVLWWKQQRPEAYARISKFVLPTTYVAGRLCGLRAVEAYLDYTCLHFSGFGDVRGLCWSDELLETFGVDRRKMPEIVEPWRIVGRLTRAAADAMGLAEGTPVCAGAGDQAATSLGAGIVRPGLAFDVAGTASVFSCCTDKYASDVRHKTVLFARSVLKGLWIPLAYTNGSGLCVRWIRDILAGQDPSVGYDSLAEEAVNVAPGSDHLLFVPHFSGRVCPNNPHVRGSFAGLTLNHTRAHLYRAVLESIGYEYRLYYDILTELTGIDIGEVHVIGGGARGALFNQIKADILGVNYTALNASDTASLGAALIAGHAVGVYPDLAAAADGMLQKAARFDFNPGRHAQYEPLSRAYPLLLEALEGLYKIL